MRIHRWNVTLAALALTTLTACGGGGEDSGESTGESEELTVLTDEQAEQALLSETVMGADFTAGEPSESANDGAPGCLAALDDLDDIGAEIEAEVEYTSTSEVGLPSVEHSVYSYTEIDPISERIEEVSTALDGCDTVEETDEDGTEFTLDVTLSTDTTSEVADEQIALTAVGTVTSQGQQLPLGVFMSSVRVDNHVSVIVYTDIPDDEETTQAAFESYVDAAAERLAAVAAGDTPSEEPLA